jgi:hypothetical protein
VSGLTRVPLPAARIMAFIMQTLSFSSYRASIVSLYDKTISWAHGKDQALVCYNGGIAPVAQLDRVLVSEAKGREFESRRAHHQ